MNSHMCRAAVIAAALSLAGLPPATAAEIRVLTAGAFKPVVLALVPDFEKQTGHKVTVDNDTAGALKKRIEGGEAFDVAVITPDVIDELVAKGKIAAGSRVSLASVGVGVVVKEGAPKPDVSTVEAFKRAVLEAKSVTYLPVPGVPQLLERLGLKDSVAAKATIPKSDTSAEMVAKGEVELAIVAITQGYTVPGVAIAGPLPSEIQFYTVFGGAVSANSQAPEAARTLLNFLKSPTAIPVIKEQGMEPL
jgi:molybdate transport system substrate-binding protein